MKGKRVVITGAAGVFGTWIARAFAEKGASLYLCDNRAEALQGLADDPVIQTAQEVILHPLDLLDRTAMEELTQRVEAIWGAPDFVINNAGIYPSQSLLEMSREEWDGVLGLNLTAPFALTQALGKLMIKQQVQGVVINMVSKSARVPRIGSGHYAVSKAGLEMLTRAYAMELAPHGIRVNAVSPGFAPGSQVSQLSESYIERMVEQIPLGRTSGPKDVPQAILFLCSEQASYITGTTLVVDGGSSAGNYQLPPSREQVQS